MKILACVGFFIVLLTGSKAQCSFDPEEYTCAEKLGIEKNTIHGVYKKTGSSVDKYAECVFKARGYQAEGGDIDYDKIKNDPHAILIIARHCDDIFIENEPVTNQQRFRNAVDACSKNRPPADISHEQAVQSVRKCIIEKFQESKH